MTRPVPVRDRALTVAQNPADPNLARANFRPGGFPPSRRASLETPPLVSALVARLEAEIGALRDRVAVLERQAGVRRADDRDLIRALVRSVGAAVFSAAELLAHAAIDRELAAALRRYPTARRIGKALRALADHPFDGVVLRRVTRDNQGVLWAVQVAPDLHAGPWPGEDTGA